MPVSRIASSLVFQPDGFDIKLRQVLYQPDRWPAGRVVSRPSLQPDRWPAGQADGKPNTDIVAQGSTSEFEIEFNWDPPNTDILAGDCEENSSTEDLLRTVVLAGDPDDSSSMIFHDG